MRRALALVAALTLAAAAPAPEQRLAALRAEALRAAPSPRQLLRIAPALALADGFDRAGRPAKAGAALNVAAIYALLGGDLPRAVAIADRAAVRCGRSGDRVCFGQAMNQGGIALWRLNDPYAAMQRLGRGARAFAAAGDVERAAIARVNAAGIRYDIGDLEGALAAYEAIDRQLGQDRRWDPVGMLNSKAEVELKLGRLDAARRTAARAVVLANGPRSTATRWDRDVVNATRGTTALVAASAGDAATALPLLRAYLASAARSGSPVERRKANATAADGLLRLGRPAEAYPFARAAVALLDGADPAERRDTHELASRVAAAVGRPTEALAQLRAAEAVRRELAAATLRSAINDAAAQTAVAEREAQLARRDARFASQRTRLFGWTAALVLAVVLLAAALLARARAQGVARRYAAVLSERTRMAREVHDTLLQGFTGVTLQLHAAARSDPAKLGTTLGTVADEAGRWLAEARRAVWDMRPSDGDLRAGLEQAVALARLQSDAAIALDCAIDTRPAPAPTAALLRVAQEALANAARHARATRIAVAVAATPRRATLSVTDDGVGFRAAPGLSALGGHWGLLGMRERIEALGGALTVDTAPGRGTRVLAELPL